MISRSAHHEMPHEQSVVLVMGTGRCGMSALVELLNRQDGVQATLAEPPLLRWSANPDRAQIAARLSRLRRNRQARLIADAAPFYLRYIAAAIATDPAIRVICLERNREQVIASYCRWLDTVYPLPTNHWAASPSEGWHHDPIWTRSFPQYDDANREECIGRYWDEYHSTSDYLANKFPDHFRIFSSSETLGTEAGRRELLAFAGIPDDRQQRLAEPLEAAPAARPHPRRKVLESASSDDPSRCVVLVPHTGQISPVCEEGLRELERRGYSVWRVGGYAAIDQGRSQMATDALAEGFEETMWIDADIGFPPDAVNRLMSHNAPIVCGIYPRKGQRVLSSYVMPGTPNVVFGQGGGLVEILYSGGGFLLVRRAVYMDMLRQLELAVCNERFGRPLIPFFQPSVQPDDDGAWYLAEDWAFCERARRCGYRIMADTTVRVWHLGTYAYGWEDAGIEQRRYQTFDLRLD